jgi:hypothetical protein
MVFSRFPPQATEYPYVLNGKVNPSPYQVIPLYEYAMPLSPLPVATNINPFHRMPYPCEVKIVEALFTTPVQFIPLYEYANVNVPPPVATHTTPFQAISKAEVVNGEVVAVQPVVPVYE